MFQTQQARGYNPQQVGTIGGYYPMTTPDPMTQMMGMMMPMIMMIMMISIVMPMIRPAPEK